MDQQEYKRITYTMLELIAFALDGGASPGTALSDSEAEELYQVSSSNGLAALTAFALQKLGIKNARFVEAYAKAQRRSILFDREFDHITGLFEAEGIPYLPLKGILLKKLYPSPHLREMADLDILFFGSPDRMKEIMTGAGYTVKRFGTENHDVYQKDSFYNVEMHRALVDGSLFPRLDRYFSSLTYTHTDGSAYRMQMSLEQMYTHLVAHAYVHDTLAGTGIRTLLDINLYLKEYGDRMDPEAVREALAETGLTEYEADLRALSKKLLSPSSLSAKERGQLDAYVYAGKYGNQSRYIHNRMERIFEESEDRSKLSYIRTRLKYKQKNIDNSPFYSRHPRLAPLLYITRPVSAVFTRPKSVINEIKQLKNRK